MWPKRKCLQDSSRLDEVVDMWLSRTLLLDGDIRKNDPFCAHLGCFFGNWSGTLNWFWAEEHRCKFCQWLQSNYWKSSSTVLSTPPSQGIDVFRGAHSKQRWRQYNEIYVLLYYFEKNLGHPVCWNNMKTHLLWPCIVWGVWLNRNQFILSSNLRNYVFNNYWYFSVSISVSRESKRKNTHMIPH